MSCFLSGITYFPNLFLPLRYFKRCIVYFWHLFLLVKHCWSQPLCPSCWGKFAQLIGNYRLPTLPHHHILPPAQPPSPFSPNSPFASSTTPLPLHTLHHLDPIRIISIASLNIEMGRRFQNLLKLFKAFKHTRYLLTYLPTNCQILKFSTLSSIENSWIHVIKGR